MSKEVARREMLEEFVAHCARPRSEVVDKALNDIFDANIAVLLDDGRVVWAGRERRFALSCAAGLGSRIERALRFNTVPGQEPTMTDVLVLDVARELIPCWEKVCPLPPANRPGGVAPLFSGCDLMRSFLSMGPA